MIYRREQPVTPSKRFKSVILNPVGTKIKKKAFFKNHQNVVGLHKGVKVCYKRKKSIYTTKLNITYGINQKNISIINQISLSRRHKTFCGLLKYSNGSINCLPLFSGAYLGQIIKTLTYIKTPKMYFFSNPTTGTTIPLGYLYITNCFFNTRIYAKNFAFFCRSGGTFCVILRMNVEKGHCIVKIPSGKFQILNETCYVMLGRNSNSIIKGIWLGKAGINLKKGFRPTVRGVAMNPIDHPHGGRTKSNSPERTPWGKIAKFNK